MTQLKATNLPAAYAQAVADGIEGILAHQQPDGGIVYDPAAPVVYPQQAIFPLAFAWAGMDPERRWFRHAKVHHAIECLGEYLLAHTKEDGAFSYDSHGHKVDGVDQRLTYAWVEGLRLLREHGAKFPFEPWGARIQRACETLIERRLKRLIGVRRFIGRVMGTSTNHVALYLTTLFRAGQVLGRKDFEAIALPMARALARDVHPDGYWEEHGDLLRSGGPTPSYNYLTHCAMGLMYEWTGEADFLAAVERSTRFHGDFCYPDASFFDLIDERVRYDRTARIWGHFAFSHTAEGRGTAAAHFLNWSERRPSVRDTPPEALARCCENYLYWHPGETAPAPFERYDHRARLTLPGGIFRRGPWCLGLSAIGAANAADGVYRDNPFALERQKLFSVWHQKAGLILDGSHSKGQPENGTFASSPTYGYDHEPRPNSIDFLPCGGSVGEEGADWVVRAAYKSFWGHVRLRMLSETTLQLDLSVDPAGHRGPFTAGFTFHPRETLLSGLSGKTVRLETQPAEATGKELGGGFKNGIVQIKGPDAMRVNWPLSPFNSYAANRVSPARANLVRVSVELTPKESKASFIVSIMP